LTNDSIDEFVGNGALLLKLQKFDESHQLRQRCCVGGLRLLDSVDTLDAPTRPLKPSNDFPALGLLEARERLADCFKLVHDDPGMTVGTTHSLGRTQCNNTAQKAPRLLRNTGVGCAVEQRPTARGTTYAAAAVCSPEVSPPKACTRSSSILASSPAITVKSMSNCSSLSISPPSGVSFVISRNSTRLIRSFSVSTKARRPFHVRPRRVGYLPAARCALISFPSRA